MRTGTIIAIVVVIAVVLGGIYFYSDRTERTGFEEPGIEQGLDQPVQEDAREEPAPENLASREDDASVPDQTDQTGLQAGDPSTDATAPDADRTDATSDTTSAGPATDGPTVIGDEITEDTTVVQSETEEAVILDADDVNSSARIVGESETVDSAVTLDTDTGTDAATGTDTVATGDSTADNATADEPAELLTPENFDRDEVMTLIENSDELSSDQRSTLTALVEGASANPAMVDAAIDSIRAALDLPTLN